MGSKAYRTIDPAEAEMMIIILRLEVSLNRYPTGEEIAASMEEPIERIRSLVSAVNSGGHEYVASQRLKEKPRPGEPRKRGAPLATYHLADKFMVRYPRTGFFLTTANSFKKDKNSYINEQQFREQLSAEHGFTSADLDDDFDWCTKKDYIGRFPAKNPTTFQLYSRTQAEREWLDALSVEYLRRR